MRKKFGMEIAIVVAADEHNGIGFNNQLLCHLPNDLKFFKTLTTGGTVLMGRNTYESIGKPLPNRVNYVLSNTLKEIAGCKVFSHMNEAIEDARKNGVEKLFIIGGSNIYKQVFSVADTLYFTRIHSAFQADAFFPHIKKEEWLLVSSNPQAADEKNAFAHTFELYHRVGSPAHSDQL